MKTITLERKIQNVIKIDRSRSVIELGVNTYPYLEVTSIDVPDILVNSRIKTINGLFTGGEDVTLIRARNHIPILLVKLGAMVIRECMDIIIRLLFRLHGVENL